MDGYLRCDQTVRLVGSWIDGALDPAQRELVELHLLVCPPCLEYVGKVTDLRAALLELAGPQTPGRLLARLQGDAP
ncbi:anti-sigma factor family protein [Plantactinospora sp. WMMC1484]|uniref:anti-sigma factor family protein n=1 Tax=Plantactinospora sp. WMMC1484 TaxID=3404122 RepID=UPI003BF60883